MRSALLLLLVTAAAAAQSVYTQRPDDPQAVIVQFTPGQDATSAIQGAIDKVQAATPSGQGIVFLPQGRYRITHTLYVWPGIRVLGFGAHRPVLELPANTPGFQKDLGYMVFFAGGRPSQSRRRRGPLPTEPFPGTVPPLADLYDANPGTFYSAMSNIDFQIDDGNPAAVGIRFHIAQHCFLTHMDFAIGSGMAALKDVGNEAEDLHFHGGRFGIVTSKPSPGWQFTLLDSTFDGQREAAIQEHEAGLTLIRAHIANVPTAISIDPGYAEELWVQESRFENIAGPAIVIANQNNQRTQISLKDVLCQHVPTLAHFRQSGKDVRGPAQTYEARLFTHGLNVQLGGTSRIETTQDLTALPQLPAALPPRIRPIPSSDTWTSVHTLGVKGDGITDETAALEAAIASHRILYLPQGRYLISRPLTLKPDTILIGLHPSTTQLFLADHTPAFDGPGAPAALLNTPPDGTNLVTGIGLFAGGVNTRAAGAMWQAGADSLMDDVRFLGGHGTTAPDGTRANPYNPTHSADPDPAHRWDAQYPSLWVLNGGGGVFTNIWTPDTYAQAGLYVSNTQTPGHVYELSSEHHVRNEAVLTHAANWEIVALQTEEEWGEGPACLPLEINDSDHILIANMHSYRVVGSRQTFPYAVRLAHSHNITFRNLHIDSDSKVSFNDAVFNADTRQSTRDRELGTLILGTPTSGNRNSTSQPTGLTRVATGFYNISGAVTDSAGNLFFLDPSRQLIYRYSPTDGTHILRDAPLDATNLAIDRSGNLLVISYQGNGTVYEFNPAQPRDELTVLKPQPSTPRPGATPYLPVDHWALRPMLENPALFARPYQYVASDASTFLPAGNDFVQGELYYGTKMSDVLRTFALAPATPGQPFYLTDEEEHKTYSAKVASDGTLSNLKLFAEQGGESVTVGPDGNVYLAAGEIYVFTPTGTLLRTLQTPERPIDLIFAGPGHRTLYILARTSLYTLNP
jgi:sugar lactone lactonase YvrE